MLNNKGIAFKLCFYILFFTILISTVIFIYSYFSIKDILVAKAEEDAETVALAAASKIDKVFNASEKIAEIIATLQENTKYSKSDIKEVLSAILKNHNEVYGTCIAFQPGMFQKKIKSFAPYVWKNKIKDKVSYIDISHQYNYFYSDWYQIPKELKRPYWSEPYYDDGAGNIIMTTYSVPFYKKINNIQKFAGITTVDISLEWLRKFLKEIRIYKNGYVFIISKKGTIVSHPNEKIIMNESIFSIAESSNNPDLRKLGREMIKGKRGFKLYKSMVKNNKGLIYYTPLDNGWALGVFYPEGEILSNLLNQGFKIILLIAVGLLIIVAIIVSVSHKITRPLHKLTLALDEIGAGNFDIDLPKINKKDEIGKLTSAFATMKKELKFYIHNLKKTTAQKEKIESELRIAHRIQMSMVPRLFPAFPERPEFDIFASMVPAKSVGGDLYDFFFLDDNKFCFVIGDVSGKGIPAALYMAVCRTMLRGKSSKNLPAHEMMIAVNNELSADNDMAMFITLFICILNVKTGEIDFCNAGHNPPYIRHNSGSFELLKKVHGAPVGVFENEQYSSGKITLDKGDSIILYTDGVTEAININNEQYTNQRLKNIIMNITDNTSSKDILKTIKDDLESFVGDAEPSDDITIEVLKYNGE